MSCFQNCGESIDGFLSTSFAKLGMVTAEKPWRTIGIMTFVAIVFGSGWAVAKEESRAEKLWIPQKTQATTDRDWVDQYFTTETRVNILLCYDDGGNVLTPSGLKECWTAWDNMMNVKVQSDEITDEFNGSYSYDGRTIDGNTTEALCDKQGGTECATSTIFDIWNRNETIIMNLVQSQIDEDIADALENGFSSPNDVQRSVRSLVSDNPTVDSISAQAMVSIIYTPLSEQHYVDENKNIEVDPILNPYQLAIFNTIKKGKYNRMMIMYNNAAWAEEFSAAIRKDIFKLVIAYLLLFVYLFMALGRRDEVFSARALAFSILLTILLSAMGGLGLCWHVGILQNPLVNTLYFLLLGLGVDDGFIIQGEFMQQSRQYPKKSISWRISETCRRAGVSVLVTSFTDICAFAVGASSSLPALRAFCILAAVTVFFVWMYNVTFFLAVMTLDARRSELNSYNCFGLKMDQEGEKMKQEGEKQGCLSRIPCCRMNQKERQGYDCLCCISAKEEHFRFASAKDQKGCCPIPFTSIKLFTCKPDIASGFFRDILGPFVVKFRFVVLAVVAVMFALGVYGMTEITQEFKIQWFLPRSSPIYQYIEISDELFGQSAVPYYLYLSDVDYYAQEDTILALLRHMEAQDYTSGNVTCVTREYKEYYSNHSNVPANAGEYYTGLKAFVDSDAGESYKGLIKWVNDDDPAAGITVSKMNHQIKNEYIETSSQQVVALDDLREDAYSVIEYPILRVYDEQFIFWEQFAVIALEFWRNVILALVTVTVIIIFMIPHPTVAIVVILSVVFSIMDLIGFLHLWKGSINNISAIYLVVSIGLTVDYAAHIGHGYIYEAGTREEKAIGTLARVGTSVFNGGFSTILAVLIMSTSDTYIFITFFKCYFLCCVFGLMHGMLFLPAMLSIVGPEVQFRESVSTAIDEERVGGKVTTELAPRELR